jgi:transaldolase
MTKLHQLHELGQSTWLNYMRRQFIQSGGLRERIGDGIQGVTANAAVFEKTVSKYGDYDQQIRAEVRGGHSTTRIHEALMIDDVQRAADLLHPIYESSDGLNGFASLELDPALTNETVCAVATARRMLARIDRGNVMVELPATPQAIAAFETLITDGVSINMTHVFSIAVFERVAQAYIAGLETFFDTHSVWRTAPTAVASFSVSAIDQAVDEQLAKMNRVDLIGKTGVAMARLLYARFQEIFTGPRWKRLAAKGARVLRPKWTRIEPNSEKQNDTYYPDRLIGPNTVLTFTLPTLETFLDHGAVSLSIYDDLPGAKAQLAAIENLEIDLENLMEDLQKSYLAASDRQYQSLVQGVIGKLFTVVPGVDD